MDAGRALSKRKYPFNGSDAEYMRHLESEVERLKEQLQQARLQSLSVSSQQSHLDVCIVNPAPRNTAAIKPAASRVALTCKDAEAFLARTPTDLQEWLKTSCDAQLSKLSEIVDAFQTLTLTTSSICSDTPGPVLEPTSSLVVTAYQRLHVSLRQHAKKFIQLRNYSLLLFFSTCRVARQNGMSAKKVDKIAMECLPDRQLKPRSLQRFRTAAGLMAHAIEQLECERGSLGSLLFLICCPSMRTCQKWADQQEIVHHLVAQIKEKTKWLKNDVSVYNRVSDHNRVSFAPAFLIAYLGIWPLEDVNKGLGTHLDQEEFVRRKRIVDTEIAKLPHNNTDTHKHRLGETTTSSHPAKKHKRLPHGADNLGKTCLHLLLGEAPAVQGALPIGQGLQGSASSQTSTSDESPASGGQSTSPDSLQNDLSTPQPPSSASILNMPHQRPTSPNPRTQGDQPSGEQPGLPTVPLARDQEEGQGQPHNDDPNTFDFEVDTSTFDAWHVGDFDFFEFETNLADTNLRHS